MRHAIGIVLAVAMAAAIFFAASWGYIKLLRLPVPAGSVNGLPSAGGSLWSNHQVLEGMGALLLAGLLAGLLVAIRWVSPLAAGLPGLVLLAWTGVYLSNVHDAVRVIPLRTKDFGQGFEALGVNGILALAGVAMITPLFIPSRWRTPAQPDVVDEGFTEESGSETTALLGEWTTPPTVPRPPFQP